MNIDINEAAKAIAKILKRSAVKESEETLVAFARCAIGLDLEFMESSGVAEGALYDDEAAFSFIKTGIKKAMPDLLWLTDDFTDAWEEYLDGSGYIEWE